MAPSSQKAGERPISFLLSDGQGSSLSVPLVIRPEDLQLSEPNSATVQRTLGGAFGDNFGPGVSSINISGHTGWRGGIDGDGAQQFAFLKDTVWTSYHKFRADAVAAGRDPSTVKLVFADVLDNITVSVLPMNFTLKRNKARPLLMMYQINMLVLGEDVAPEFGDDDGEDFNEGDSFDLGLDSLQDSLDRLEDASANLSDFLDANIIGPVEGLMTTANMAFGRVLSTVNRVERAIFGPAAQLVSFARDIAQTGRNAMYTYAALTSMPDFARAAVMDIASSFDNAFCVLSNVMNVTSLYPNYSDIYGASNCSSTFGGSPLSPLRTENALGIIIPSYQPVVAVTPLAQTNLGIINGSDYLLHPMPTSELGLRLNNVTQGVTFHDN